MNNTERKASDLIPFIQADFPITERPFQNIAERIGWNEESVIAGLRKLSEEKIVRRLGPVFEAGKLGYVSTLVAVRIEQERIAELAVLMLDIPEITHNYVRDHDMNLWFTITAHSPERLDDIVNRVDSFPGVSRLYNLPMVEVYKIQAVFDAKTTVSPVTPLRSDPADAAQFSETDIEIIKSIQADFPLIKQPFASIAEKSGTSEEQVISTLSSWIDTGVIRRFGARINHRRHGYAVNTLVAWKGNEIESWGAQFAQLSYVSHCYRRRLITEWPFELYTMVHAKSESEMESHLSYMNRMARNAQMLALKTLYELKKTSMNYFSER